VALCYSKPKPAPGLLPGAGFSFAQGNKIAITRIEHDSTLQCRAWPAPHTFPFAASSFTALSETKSLQIDGPDH